MVTFTVFESVFFLGVLPSINQTALSMIVKIGMYVLTVKRTVDAINCQKIISSSFRVQKIRSVPGPGGPGVGCKLVLNLQFKKIMHV